MKSRTKKRPPPAVRGVGRPAHDADLTTDAGRFGARLRAARQSAGLSVLDAARRALVTPGTWYDWELGRRSEGIQRFAAIVRAVLAALDCEIDDLLDEGD
jgi:hypothetical protein